MAPREGGGSVFILVIWIEFEGCLYRGLSPDDRMTPSLLPKQCALPWGCSAHTSHGSTSDFGWRAWTSHTPLIALSVLLLSPCHAFFVLLSFLWPLSHAGPHRRGTNLTGITWHLAPPMVSPCNGWGECWQMCQVVIWVSFPWCWAQCEAQGNGDRHHCSSDSVVGRGHHSPSSPFAGLQPSMVGAAQGPAERLHSP